MNGYEVHEKYGSFPLYFLRGVDSGQAADAESAAEYTSSLLDLDCDK